MIIRSKLINNISDFTCPLVFQKYLKDSKYGMLEIIVEDTGIGIRQDDQRKMFKLFGFLINTSQLNTRGVGLGLHISKQIAKQLGGNVHLESEVGLGSKFVFVVALEER